MPPALCTRDVRRFPPMPRCERRRRWSRERRCYWASPVGGGVCGGEDAISPGDRLIRAYLIVFESILAFTAYFWLLERYSATLVAMHTFVNPIQP